MYIGMYVSLTYLGVGWTVAQLLSCFVRWSSGDWLLIYLFGESIWLTHTSPSVVYHYARWTIFHKNRSIF